MHAWILVKVRDMHNSNGPLFSMCFSYGFPCATNLSVVAKTSFSSFGRWKTAVLPNGYKGMWPDCTIQLVKWITVSQLLPKTHLSRHLFTSTIVILGSNTTADCDWWIEACSFKTVLLNPGPGRPQHCTFSMSPLSDTPISGPAVSSNELMS